MPFEYEWDPAKNLANFSKHGVYFEQAIDVFDDPLRREFLSLQGMTPEIRRLVVGKRGAQMLTVICTDRNSAIRIISARKARRNERRTYDQSAQAW